MDWSSSYNARNSTPEQIASSFVKPRDFDSITNFQSKVLVGPRGIGKTTIFKLLTPSGIHHVRKRDGFEELALDHVPLYIPSDTLWKGEASSFEAMLADGSPSFSTKQIGLIQNALFVDYSLYEAISSLQDCSEIAEQYYRGEDLDWCFEIDPQREGSICELCAEAWDLPTKPKSFLGLRLALLRRQNIYTSLINSLDEPSEADFQALVGRNLFVSLRAFFDIIENFCGPKKWSIHFDEMEIAPKSILNAVYQSMRSFDRRAVVKFSLFPYIDFISKEEDGRTGPREGHDFETLVLSGRFKNENYNFSDEIVATICERRGVSREEFRKFVNLAADRDSLDVSEGDKTRRRYVRIFSSLQHKDESFKKYLSDKGISLSKIPEYSENDRMPHIRKLAGVAEFRNSFLRSFINGKSIRSSRKSHKHYSNYNQLLKLTEQNPRALSFYVEDIIRGMKSSGSPERILNEVINKNVDRFRALVATQIVPYDPANNGAFAHALDVVDNLGREISAECLDRAFQPEPSLAFKISKNMDDYALRILGIAANSGAIILEPARQQSLHLDISKMRFRISYQLAPWYPIPTQLGNSKIISRLTFKRVVDQPSLFGWETEE